MDNTSAVQRMWFQQWAAPPTRSWSSVSNYHTIRTRLFNTQVSTAVWKVAQRDIWCIVREILKITVLSYCTCCSFSWTRTTSGYRTRICRDRKHSTLQLLCRLLPSQHVHLVVQWFRGGQFIDANNCPVIVQYEWSLHLCGLQWCDRREQLHHRGADGCW